MASENWPRGQCVHRVGLVLGSSSGLQHPGLCLHSHAFLSFLQVIFRFALAVFKYKEEEILKLQDSMSIFKYLRYFTRTILDAR